MQERSGVRGLVVDKMGCGQEKKSLYKGDEAAHSIFKQQRVFEVLYSVSFTIHIRFLLLI